VASEEIYGDEGAETPEGFLDFEEIGIPLLVDGSKEYFNRFPADQTAAAALNRTAGAAGRIALGPFVTVSTVTGSRDRAAALGSRFSAVCENMEGAAAAHAAASWGVAFAEIRGISNAVGPRDRASWQIEKAASQVQEAVIRFLCRRGSGR
jgi:futalosine hydrolase